MVRWNPARRVYRRVAPHAGGKPALVWLGLVFRRVNRTGGLDGSGDSHLTEAEPSWIYPIRGLLGSYCKQEPSGFFALISR